MVVPRISGTKCIPPKVATVFSCQPFRGLNCGGARLHLSISEYGLRASKDPAARSSGGPTTDPYWSNLVRKPEGPLILGAAMALGVAKGLAEGVGALTQAVAASTEGKATSRSFSSPRQVEHLNVSKVPSPARTTPPAPPMAPVLPTTAAAVLPALPAAGDSAGSPSGPGSVSVAGLVTSRSSASTGPNTGVAGLVASTSSASAAPSNDVAGLLTSNSSAPTGASKGVAGLLTSSASAGPGSSGGNPGLDQSTSSVGQGGEVANAVALPLVTELQGGGGDMGGGSSAGGGGNGGGNGGRWSNGDGEDGSTGPFGIPYAFFNVPWLSLVVFTPAAAYVWWRVHDPEFQQWWSSSFPEAPAGVSAEEYTAWDPTYLGCTAEQSHSIDAENEENTRNKIIACVFAALAALLVAHLATKEHKKGGSSSGAKQANPRSTPPQVLPRLQSLFAN